MVKVYFGVNVKAFEALYGKKPEFGDEKVPGTCLPRSGTSHPKKNRNGKEGCRRWAL